MGNVEAVKSKVEKLFKKAESAKELGSLEEAATFMAKAQEILMKYNLEKSELNLGDEENSPIEIGQVDLKDSHGWVKTEGQWLFGLFNTVARNNFCKVVKVGDHQVKIIGEENNMDVVKFMVANIVPKIRELEKKRWGEYHGPDKRGAFRRAYLAGAVHGIHIKLTEQQATDKEKYSGLQGIIVLQDQLVDEKMAEAFGRLRKSRSRRLSSGSGAMQGRRDGKNLKLDPGVKGGSKGSSTKYLK